MNENPRVFRTGSAVLETLLPEEQQPRRFVRLSQIRKLRHCEQVAAVCYRVRGGAIEFLLVRTRGSGRWTFPKGSAERGLTHAQAAALEAFEEAGVHGRIEETAFTRYVRRRRMGQPDSGKRSAKKEAARGEVEVTAHLCEVLRLSPPQESKRERTWFSATAARKALQQGRRRDDGAEFARVIDRAVARIESFWNACELVDDQRQPRANLARRDALQKDPLQQVRFDFEEGYRGMDIMPRVRKFGGMRRSAMPVLETQRLRGEVLEFSPPRKGRPKALGAGTNLSG